MQPAIRLATSIGALVILAASAVRAGDMSGPGSGYRSLSDGGSNLADPGPYPPDAQPGQCYAKMIVPAQTETYSEQIMVTPPRTVEHVVPGQCGFQERTVVVREPSVEMITVPATYRNVTETVVVKPAGVRVETVPARFDIVQDQVLVRPAHTEWRRTQAVGGFIPGGYGDRGVPPYAGAPTEVLPTGEVLCLVQVPAEYRLITRQVMRTPARTVEIPYPAETALVSRQIVDIPAHQERRDRPGETRVTHERVCAPNQTVTENLPAEFRSVTRTRTITPARLEWRPIACQPHEPSPQPAAPPPAPRHAHRHMEDCRCRRHPVMGRPHVSQPPVPAPSSPPPAAPAKTPPAAPTAAPTPTGDRAVRAMQASLAVKGYYKGPKDGLFTQETMDAMKHFQRDNHLPEGRFTAETANALGVQR